MSDGFCMKQLGRCQLVMMEAPDPQLPLDTQVSGPHTGSYYAGRECPRRGWTSPDDVLQQETRTFFLNVRISDSRLDPTPESPTRGDRASKLGFRPPQSSRRMSRPIGAPDEGSAPLSSWRRRLHTHPQGSCICVSNQRYFLWLSGRKI